MGRKKIAFRADGNSQIGLGHLVRSAALAAYLKVEFDCVLITRCHDSAILKSIKNNFQSILPLSGSIENEKLKLEEYKIVVLDGYHFDETYQRSLKDRYILVVCIDDLHSGFFYADVIINIAGSVKSMSYDALPECRFYLGPRFALLRTSFLNSITRVESEKRKLLISMGGADPSNHTILILDTILPLNAFDEYHIIVGNGYLFKADLVNRVRHIGENVIIHHALMEHEMAKVMSWCGTAICSASGVAYEYLSIGGSLFLILTADNQKDIYHYLIQEGLAFDVANISKISNEEIKRSGMHQKTVFDGKAGVRIQQVFLTLSRQLAMSVRYVNADDLIAWHTLSNDTEVRMQSYIQQSISIEEHTAWFHTKLNDPEAYLYFVEENGSLIAQMRFQVSRDIVTFGYAIETSHRGTGLGSTVISMGLKKFTDDYPKAFHLHAYVKNSNIASQRSFERLNFTKQETLEFPDSILYTLFYAGNNNR